MATKYVLTMTEEQAKITVAALDFFVRMYIGQWEELARLTPVPKSGNIREYRAARDRAEYLLLEARAVVMPDCPRGGSWSVYKFPETERAFNVLKAVRSAIAWHEHPEGGITVNFDRPSAVHVSEIMPTCEAVEQ